jgi:hypothetical protein
MGRMTGPVLGGGKHGEKSYKPSNMGKKAKTLVGNLARSWRGGDYGRDDHAVAIVRDSRAVANVRDSQAVVNVLDDQTVANGLDEEGLSVLLSSLKLTHNPRIWHDPQCRTRNGGRKLINYQSSATETAYSPSPCTSWVYLRDLQRPSVLGVSPAFSNVCTVEFR